MSYKTNYSDLLKDPRWQKKRLEILNRDEFMCVLCSNEKSTLHVHHVGYAESGKPWDVNNELLQTLCEECHKEEEEYLKETKPVLFDKLRRIGFSADMLANLPTVFIGKNRGWWKYSPSIEILKMAVTDDEIWQNLTNIYFERLSELVKDMRHE
jgi:glutaredoxin